MGREGRSGARRARPGGAGLQRAGRDRGLDHRHGEAHPRRFQGLPARRGRRRARRRQDEGPEVSQRRQQDAVQPQPRLRRCRQGRGGLARGWRPRRSDRGAGLQPVRELAQHRVGQPGARAQRVGLALPVPLEVGGSRHRARHLAGPRREAAQGGGGRQSLRLGRGRGLLVPGAALPGARRPGRSDRPADLRQRRPDRRQPQGQSEADRRLVPGAGALLRLPR